MTRSKTLSLLVGIFLVACAATFAAMRVEERREQIKSSNAVILELPSEEVQSLAWEYQGNSLAFHRDGDWRYDGDASFPVSEEKINGLLEQFQAFGAAFIIEDAEDLGQYGLDDPVCTIRLATEAQTYEIKLGGYSKMDAQRYLSIGDGNVYLAVHDPLDEFDAVLSDMILHDEIPSFDHVTSIQFSGAESCRITYEENSAGTCCAEDVCFTQQNGKNLPLDPAKVDRYLRSMTGLNPVDYVSYNATEEELQAYGLDAPELTVTVAYTAEGEDGAEIAETFVLAVSPDPEEAEAAAEAADSDQEKEVSAYIRVGESPIIYHISSGNYKTLTAVSYNDLRHSEVFWADFSEVRQIDLSLDGDSYTLTAAQDGDARTWFFQGEEFEIADLQGSLEALDADEFTSERPAQKEEIGLTVYLDNENCPDIQIALYRYDGTHCLAAVDGESVSLVERTAVVDLIEAVHAVVLG